ncbi:MAG: hypothetical protein K9J13_03210 [Saprospiraceae bacterium]|nr:hypothetical protein [Saprospiraceae bacterium]
MNLKNIACYVFFVIAVLFQSCDLKPGKTIEVTIEIVADDSTPIKDIEETINIISNRINSFGVRNVDIQRLTEKNQYLIKMDRVTEEEIPRVLDLITTNAKLGFWKTYEFAEISSYLMEANEKITDLLNSIEKKVEVKEEIIDTSTSLVDLVNRDDNTNETARQDYKSLFAYLQPNVYQNENGQYYPGKGPVSGRAEKNDKDYIDSLLNIESIRNLFPKDLKFFWTARPIKDFNGEVSSTYELVSLRMERNGEASLGGDYITDVRQAFSSNSGNEILIEMNANGARKWLKLTKENIGKSIAIVIDDCVYSYPTVQSEISGGRSSITGDFSLEEAKDIACIMKSGRLPINVRVINQKTIDSH